MTQPTQPTTAAADTRGSTLSLTRKVGESIHIGKGLVLEVSQIRGGVVRLRFHTAAGAEQLPIYRAEIAPGRIACGNRELRR